MPTPNSVPPAPGLPGRSAREVVFRTTVYIAELQLHEQRVVTFTAGDPRRPVTYEWRRRTADEQTRWAQAGEPTGRKVESVLTATVRASFGGKPGAVLAGIAEGVWPTTVASAPTPFPGEPPFLQAGGRIAEDARVYAGSLPEYASSAFYRLADELRDSADRAARTLAWRAGARSRYGLTFAREGVSISPDATRWVPVVDSRGWRLINRSTDAFPVDASPSLVGDVERALNESGGEPVGRTLLREARHAARTSYRAGLVLAVAAAEVGFKQAVATLVPHSAWLVQELPSPPLARMLEKYLPKLPVRATWPNGASCPEHIVKAVRNANDWRNTLVHRGEVSISGEQMNATLLAVSDLPWLLDSYLGHGWAPAYLSDETRAVYGLPPGGQPEPTLILWAPPQPSSQS